MSDRLVSVELRAKVAGYNRDIASAAAVTSGFAKQVDSADRGIDKFSGRLGLAVDAVASFGPAFVPIGAVGIPALTGLASSLGFVAVGLGAVLASAYGVGDSLKALNKYALEPTDANLQKVEQTLLKLAPEAQDFVLKLRRLGPELKAVRDAGAGELFPHWSDAIDDLEVLLPTVEELVSRVSRKVGEISEQSAESLAGPRWTEFYSFLEREAPLAIGKIAKSVGSLGHATAELWMAFDPLNDDFLNVLVKGSDKIDDWATGLSKTQGFQEFVDYIEANGPQVGETIGAIAGALLDIVEAAAPVGAATLPILEAVADVIGTIADSDLGTPILAMLTLSRGLALVNRARPTGLISDFKTLRNYDMNLWGAATAGGLKAATKETERYDAALKRIHGNLGKLAGGAVALGGLMAVQSGLTDKIGLTNTAMGATAGLMVGGPWGAAIGGGIGLVMDFADGQKSAAVSAEDLADAINLQTLALGKQGYAAIGESLSGYQDAIDATGLSLEQVISASVNGGAELDHVNTVIKGYLSGLGDMEVGTSNYLNASGAATGADLDQVDAVQKLREALFGQNDAVNEATDLAKGRKAGIDAASDAQDRQTKSTKAAVGPTQDVANAIADLGDHELTASERADALRASLEALLGPGLELSAATDAWNAGLRHFDDELAKNNRTLVGNTDAADKNREALRGRVTDLQSMLNAEAGAEMGPKKFAEALRSSRKALVDQAVQAGFSRKAVESYLGQLGLAPKDVATIIRVVQDEVAKKKAKDVKAALDDIPKNTSTAIRADNSQALAGARAAQAALDRLHDVTITIRTEHMDVRLGEPRAAGGPVKAGRSYVVGERRPEIFMPTEDGTILPNTSMRSALGGPTTSGGSSAGGGPGSDSPGVLGKIIDAMLGGGFGPGLLRHFGKALDNIQHGLAKNHGKWTDELRKQARDLFKEVRDAEKERGRSIREAFKSFEDDLTQGAATIRTELGDLKRSLRDAGGVWNDALQQHAHRILVLAQKYDAQATALEGQTKTLDDLTAHGEDLANQWQSLSDTVAGNFSSDLFGNGLGGFFGTAGKDTAQATMFQNVLSQLSGMGLDGGAFQALAESGDLKTATQLLSSGMIDAFEQAFGARTTALGSLGGLAGDTVYGQQIADNNAAIQQQNVLITSTQATMASLQAAVDRQEKVLRDLAGLPQHIGNQAYQGTKQGTEDGIRGVAGDAGRRIAMAGGRRP